MASGFACADDGVTGIFVTPSTSAPAAEVNPRDQRDLAPKEGEVAPAGAPVLERPKQAVAKTRLAWAIHHVESLLDGMVSAQQSDYSSLPASRKR